MIFFEYSLINNLFYKKFLEIEKKKKKKKKKNKKKKKKFF